MATRATKTSTAKKTTTAKVAPNKTEEKKITHVINKKVEEDKPLSEEMQTLNYYLDNYRALSKKFGTDEVKHEMISEFHKLMHFVIRCAGKSEFLNVLEGLFDFFVTERHGLMSEKNALVFCDSLPKEECVKFEVFYNVFRELVDCVVYDKKFAYDINAVTTLLRTDVLTNFIISKTK